MFWWWYEYLVSQSPGLQLWSSSSNGHQGTGIPSPGFLWWWCFPFWRHMVIDHLSGDLPSPSTANIARISLMEYTQPMWCRRCVENRRWQLVIGWVGFCIVLCLALLSHGGVLWWYWCDISLIDRLLWAGWWKVHQSIHIVVPGASFKDVLLQRLIMILLWLAVAKQHKRSHCGDKRIWWSSQWDFLYCFNMKVLSYQYRESYCGDKTIIRSSYLHNGISYTDQIATLH